MSPRKRKRNQPADDDEHEHEHANEQPAALDDDETKQQQVWDAFREANYETLEQLPLTVHRQLSLMSQLDEQSQVYYAQILPALSKIVHMRRALLAPTSDAPNTSGRAESVVSHSSTNTKSIANLSTPVDGPSLSFRRNSTPLTMPAERLKLPENRQDLLAHIAWLSDEINHVSQEKVNLALATYDSVERHIRILDQSIKEQKASIAKGASHPAIHLPELVVPRWQGRPTRAALSDDDDDLLPDSAAPPAPAVPETSRSKSKKKGKSRAAAVEDPAQLTITLPATQANEELYCYCDRPSFGEMIACDGEHCAKEWFHLGCVGLREPPEGDWFCEDCRTDDS